MDIKSIFSHIKQALHNGAGVEFAFGSPSTIGDTSIIPVARVSFAFGAGGGSNPVKSRKKPEVPEEDKEQDNPQNNVGGGGGGSIKTEPVGIYTIRNDQVRFHPVVSVKEILAAFGIISILVLKVIKLRPFKRR
ncbi:MAG TPA: GerW family sporulation protein [Candidatus Cloacimonadota bacterium]|nr:GerW family sporulation protein [Candidatus Cloacimonadota bacterium]